MFTNPSPLYTPAVNNSSQYGRNVQNPNETEIMMRQKWNQLNQNQGQQQQQLDPFNDIQNELSGLSSTVIRRMKEHPDFKQAELICDTLMQQAIEEAIRPYVINDPKGRMAFERWLAIIRQIKPIYVNEELKANEQMQKLLQDEVVLKRLQELQNQQIDKSNKNNTELQNQNSKNPSSQVE